MSCPVGSAWRSVFDPVQLHVVRRYLSSSTVQPDFWQQDGHDLWKPPADCCPLVLCLHAWACILQAQLSLLHADHCVLVCNDTWQVTTSAGAAYGCPCSTSASAHIAERFCHHQVVSHTVKTSLQSAAHPRAKPTGSEGAHTCVCSCTGICAIEQQ